MLECGGVGGDFFVLLVEIILDGVNGDDFYDISFVDGYNLLFVMMFFGGIGNCGVFGCISNLNNNCFGVF